MEDEGPTLRNCNTVRVTNGSTKYDRYSSSNEDKQYKVADAKTTQRWVPLIPPTK